MKKSINLSLILRLIIWLCCAVSFALILFPIKSFMHIVNVFAYFTNLSNMFVFIITTYFLYKTFKNIKHNKNYIAKANAILHLFVVFAISVTMIVFTGLLIYIASNNAWDILSNSGKHFITEPLFHYVIPILFIIDYVLFAEHGKITYKKAADFCFYCVVYFLWLVLRAQTHTLLHNVPSINYQSYYPYPFLDINQLGVVKTIISTLTCMIGFYVYSLLLIWLDGRLNKKKVS